MVTYTITLCDKKTDPTCPLKAIETIIFSVLPPISIQNDHSVWIRAIYFWSGQRTSRMWVARRATTWFPRVFNTEDIEDHSLIRQWSFQTDSVVSLTSCSFFFSPKIMQLMDLAMSYGKKLSRIGAENVSSIYLESTCLCWRNWIALQKPVYHAITHSLCQIIMVILIKHWGYF